MDDILFDSGEKFSNVPLSSARIINRVLRASCMVSNKGDPDLLTFRYLVVTLLFYVFDDIDSSVYKVFLRQHSFENFLTIVKVDSM